MHLIKFVKCARFLALVRQKLYQAVNLYNMDAVAKFGHLVKSILSRNPKIKCVFIAH